MSVDRRIVVVLCLAGCGGSGITESNGSPSSTSTTEGGADTGTETGAETETGDETETGETGEPEGNLLLSDKILNIAHRGGGRLRPEATLIAFEHALAVGADVIEFDLHSSADDVIVVIHDATVDRTTDGSGEVHAMSFDELRLLDAGYSFSPDGGDTHPYRGMGVQIPTVDEVLDSFPDRYYLMEIKQAEPSIVPALVETLIDHGVEDRVVLASFNQDAIDEVRALAPELFTALSAAEMIDFNVNGAEPGYAPPAGFLQPPWDLTTPELVDLAHDLDMKVHPWTVNSDSLMATLVEMGVDGMMTDDPVLLDAALALP